jgi:hypothetical protein
LKKCSRLPGSAQRVGAGAAGGVTLIVGAGTLTFTDLPPLKVPFAQKKMIPPTTSTPTITPRMALEPELSFMIPFSLP